jgi:deoxyribose-phosphate aldolase
MVLSVGELKAGKFLNVFEDIRGVVQAADGRLVKVILETSYLNDEEKMAGCLISQRAGAHYVKTSTGFSSAGATVADIRLMRGTVGPLMGVKASGGIRDTATAQAMIEAGATRLGVSAGVEIVKGLQGKEQY